MFGTEFHTKKSVSAYVYLPHECCLVARKIDMVKILYGTEMANYIQLSSTPPSQSGARGLERSVCLKFYNEQKREIRFTLGLNVAKKYSLHQKKLRVKVVQNWISYKKVRKRICLSPPLVEPGAWPPKISMLEIL